MATGKTGAPLRRTITHWTGGGNRASDLDKQHYHFITEWDGNVVAGKHEPEDNIVTSDGDYAAHVLNLNKGSIGVAMAGMHRAVEQPFDAGPSPITERQFEAHCLLLAELHREHAIPVTWETCLTHAEVQPTLGVVQKGKWDLTRLPFKLDLRGALPVGDYLRERVKSYMQAGGAEVLPAAKASFLRKGMQGEEVRVLQRDLQRLGFHLGEIDGKFGQRTENAVRAFQAAHGLEVDGVAGPQTQSAILTKGTPPPLRESSEDILRARGSETIKATDGQNIGILLTGAVATAGAVKDTVEQATGILDGCRVMLRDNWHILIVLALLFVLFLLTRRIRWARVRAAVTGENLSK